MTKLRIVLAVLLLALPAFAVAAAGHDQDALRATANSARLLGPLPELIEFYRGNDRLTDESWRSFEMAKQAALDKEPLPEAMSQLKAPPPRQARKNDDLSRRRLAGSGDGTAAAPLISAYFDPAVRVKFGLPEDTFECILTLAAGARAPKMAGVHVISALPYKGGSIARVYVRGKDLEAVAGLPGLLSMMPVYKRELNNDLGGNATGAARLRIGSGGNWDPSRGYTGQGVVVGVIDSGVYFQHGDFVDPATGTTRIQYIWDTTAPPTGRTPADLFPADLPGLNWGTVWTKADIDAGLCTEFDTVDSGGHGTHTTGTSAGNGGATGLYTGMAPNADIVFVKGLDNNGIQFIYEMARRMGKPCSVNMSYGPSYPIHYASYYTNSYPMDPTDLDAQWIDALNQYYGGGHIPVKSAGNTGTWNTYTDNSGGSYPYKDGGYHWGAAMNATSSHAYNVTNYDTVWSNLGWGAPGYGDVPEIYFGCWLERPANVSLTSPSGITYTFTFGNPNGYYTTADGNRVYGVIYSTPQANGAYYGRFYIYPRGGYLGTAGAARQPTLGQWQITVIPQTPGPGNADFWAADFNLYYGGLYVISSEIYSTFAGSSSMSNYIVDEGASPFEICVGAWSTREGWNSIDGHSYSYLARPWLNTIADFSAPGPSRDRFMKPDIAAPGQIILSTLSQTSGVDPAYITTDNAHQAMSGTSMSAPHVTGGVALVLQKHPNFSVESVRDLLAAMALNDANTQAIGPNGFGAGKLNLLPLNDAPVAVISVDKNELVLDNNEKATFSGSASHDLENFPLTYAWSLVSKPAGAAPTLAPSGAKAVLTPDANIEGTYQVGLVVNDGIYDSAMATASVVAKAYPVMPPTGAALQHLMSDFIFYKEYVNKLTWQVNPANKSTLANYRVYRKAKGAADSAYALVATLAPSVLLYEEKGLKKDQLFTYKITAVNTRGKESDPVVVSN